MVVYVILKKRFETTLMVVATTTTALVLAPLVAALVIPYVAHNMLRALETCAIASLSSIAINYKNKGQQKPTKEASNGHPTC